MAASWWRRTVAEPHALGDSRGIERLAASVRNPGTVLDTSSGAAPAGTGRSWTGLFARAIHAEPGELKAVLLAFAYFFFLLSSYYILRPLRDEMGVAGGGQQLQWLFTGTFVAMLVAGPALSAGPPRPPPDPRLAPPLPLFPPGI